MIKKVLIFGDYIGIPQLLHYIRPEIVCGLVVAEIRPLHYSPVKKISEEIRVPIIIHPRPNSPEFPIFLKKIQQINPEIILVNSYSMIINPEILKIPEFHVINIHGGILPNYRGANPYQWTILNEESEAGVTIHFLDHGIDTGNVIAQIRFSITFEDTWKDIQNKTLLATEELLQKEIPRILSGPIFGEPQDHHKARYWPRRHPDDGQITWDMNVRHIYNLIRALVKPHPGAFFFDIDKKIRVLDKYLTIHQVIELKYSKKNGGKTINGKYIYVQPLLKEKIIEVLEYDFFSINNNDIILPKNINNKFGDLSKTNRYIVFTFFEIKQDNFLGLCIFSDIDYSNQSAEIGIFICNKNSNLGDYLLDLIRTLLYFALRELNLSIIFVQIPVEEEALIEIYEEVGFKKNDQLKDLWFINTKLDTENFSSNLAKTDDD